MAQNTRKRSYLKKRRGPTRKRSKRVHTLRKKKQKYRRGGALEKPFPYHDNFNAEEWTLELLERYAKQDFTKNYPNYKDLLKAIDKKKQKLLQDREIILKDFDYDPSIELGYTPEVLYPPPV